MSCAGRSGWTGPLGRIGNTGQMGRPGRLGDTGGTGPRGPAAVQLGGTYRSSIYYVPILLHLCLCLTVSEPESRV